MNRAALIIYVIIVVLSPLLFGAVHTYAYTVMTVGVLTGALLLVIQNIRKDPKSGAYQFQLPGTSLNITYFILIAFLIFQIIPLPDFLATFLSPEAHVVGKKALSASGTLLSEGHARDWFSLSPYYYPVRMSLIRFMVYGLFFLGLTQILNSQKRIEITIFLVLITACFEALYGLAETYSGSGHIWWFSKSIYQSERDVTGTYINRNHFGGLMEMCLLLAAAYAGALSGKEKKTKIIPDHKTSLRVRLSRYLSWEQRFNKRTLIVFSGAVMGIGLVFSASRGGMIATAVALLCMSLFFIFRKDHRRKGFILLVLFLITSIYAIHIGVEYPMGRFKYFDNSFESRKRYTQKTMNMFRAYPITGVGVGNFQYAYPKYQAVEDTNRFFRYAHNDWAQLLAEAGITGFFLLLAGILYYIYRTIRLWRKRSDPFAICLGIAPLGVIAAVVTHSYSDFNLHIPANCLMLVAIMAIGYSALHLERHHGRDKSLYRYHIIPLKYKGVLALLLVPGLIIWNGFWTIRHFMAEAYCNTVHNSTLNRDQSPPLEEIRKAIEWDRWNAGYWYKLAREMMRIRSTDFADYRDERLVGWLDDLNDWMKRFKSSKSHEIGDRKRAIQSLIIRALEEAVRLNPFKAEYHMRLGWEYSYLWRLLDYHHKWLSAADISIGRAAYFAGEKNPYLHAHLGNYWILRSKTINPANPEWEPAWARACWHYKKAQEIDGSKKMLKIITQHVWNFYPDREIVLEVIHDRYLKQAQKLLRH